MKTRQSQSRPLHAMPALPQPVDPSVVFVSTYPPAICGLATFTESLRDACIAVRGKDLGLGVLAIDEDGSRLSPGQSVVGRLDPSDPWSVRSAVDRIAGYDVIVLQHEYGIWGPDMGISVLDFAQRAPNPLITTLHTLLPSPTPLQRRIVEGLARRSEFTVVPTISARDLMVKQYAVDPTGVVVIPHGTRAPTPRALAWDAPKGGPRVLTWGLIGPGKGIETAFRAVAQLVRDHPDVMYTVAGRTHPKVLARDGEAYRTGLRELAADLRISDNVEFVDDYLTAEQIEGLVTASDVVLLPYDSTEQIVSGVLVEAVAANVPVVATAFPHARELAETGAVWSVPQRDPEAMATALGGLIRFPERRREMSQAQRVVAADLDWVAVARRYQELIGRTVERAAMGHAHTAS